MDKNLNEISSHPKLISLAFTAARDKTWQKMTGYDLRSAGDLNAGNTILEAVRPQTWNILITNLHLTTLKLWRFKQANLVVLGILYNDTTT